MTIISNSRLLSYKAEEIFNVVADIKQYPNILTYIDTITINKQEKNFIEATVNLSFGLWSIEYDCEIELYFHNKITTVATRGPFKRLNAEWTFEQYNDTTLVKYKLDFQLRSPLLHLMASNFLARSLKSTIKSFEHYLRSKLSKLKD
ncbi:hypothetical protein RLOatenuis_7520 [Rickettsiales bacterium]|nr:hypothetical protein RLOatenuis_7520 [Rickettsiales bacterium]